MHTNGSIRLEDYALIGNSRTAALVSRFGSMDWCCIPEFNSPAVFAALLDNQGGGFFRIHPVGEYTSVQKYLDKTNVVETIFDTSQGKMRLLEGFTAMEEQDKIRFFSADHEIIRIIEGISGSVNVSIEYSPRISYGKHSPGLKNCGELGIQFSFRENTGILQSTLKTGLLKVTGEKATGEVTVHENEKIIFSLSFSGQSPSIVPEMRTTAGERMQKTIDYWKSWAEKCSYMGIFKDLVLRSALALKLLSHAPSGAIVAAPTTSLPEDPGGVRNWDYRYCWLRDASFTIRVLLKLGYYEEAHAYMNWILHATRLTRPKLQVVYTVFGESKVKEETCEWLSGYRNSRPVRTGNSAHEQFQLDVYGEVLDAIYTYSQIVEEFDRDTKHFIAGLGKVICNLWDKPDEGIWEIRSSKVHHTHSKVMAWVGLDRILKLCRKYNWNDIPINQYEMVKNSIHREIEERGINKTMNHYTREFDGNTADASLLVLPLVEYCSASSPKMVRTREFIQQELLKNNFMFRYRDVNDGLPGKEGAFIICNFWLVENLAKEGRTREAIEIFQNTVKYAGNTGLLSEEINPDTMELLGNYPQGFSHIGLINAACAINEAIQKEETRK